MRATLHTTHLPPFPLFMFCKLQVQERDREGDHKVNHQDCWFPDVRHMDKKHRDKGGGREISNWNGLIREGLK